MIRRTPREAGFTLAEFLITAAIVVTIVASMLMLLKGGQGMFAAQSALTDQQQGLLLAVNALARDLLMAGAGTYSGPMAGSLGAFFGPVLPYRLGAVNADMAGQYFADRLTVVYVPPTVAQTRIADPLGSSPAVARITHDSGCPAADASCGFERGMAVLVMDQYGAWDTFTVSDVQGDVLQLDPRGSQATKVYQAGSYISEVTTHTYWLKTDPTLDGYQLMRYDGHQSDAPIADNVVRLTFEYFGRGEGGENEPLVAWSQAQLTDGPWRPDAVSANRYDEDLLRVRRIRVTLRVQASRAFRGAASALFMHGGDSRTSERYLPDQEIRFDVAPRNLNARP